jgi:hypothetical protein
MSALKRRVLWALLALSALGSGCAHHPARVACDGHSEAINAPHPVKATAAPKPERSP